MIDLSNLLSIVDGDKTVLNTLLFEFVRTTDTDLNELHKAIENGDTESISRLAHRIKGAASIIGATELAELANSLENAGKQRELEQLPPLLSETDDCYKSISEEINDYK